MLHLLLFLYYMPLQKRNIVVVRYHIEMYVIRCAKSENRSNFSVFQNSLKLFWHLTKMMALGF